MHHRYIHTHINAHTMNKSIIFLHFRFNGFSTWKYAETNQLWVLRFPTNNGKKLATTQTAIKEKKMKTCSLREMKVVRPPPPSRVHIVSGGQRRCYDVNMPKTCLFHWDLSPHHQNCSRHVLQWADMILYTEILGTRTCNLSKTWSTDTDAWWSMGNKIDTNQIRLPLKHFGLTNWMYMEMT